MQASAQLKVMSYGKWSDRFGGPDQPYEFVDLYDPDAGQLLTWSVPALDAGVERPSEGQDCTVWFSLEKEAKAALTEVKKGDRKGQTMGYVQEKLKVKVLAFDKPRPVVLPQSLDAAKAKAAA